MMKIHIYVNLGLKWNSELCDKNMETSMGGIYSIPCGGEGSFLADVGFSSGFFSTLGA